jgi:hypothetical protein
VVEVAQLARARLGRGQLALGDQPVGLELGDELFPLLAPGLLDLGRRPDQLDDVRGRLTQDRLDLLFEALPATGEQLALEGFICTGPLSIFRPRTAVVAALSDRRIARS